MSDSKPAKGTPTKCRNKNRGVRRARNHALQPERKLRHMLKRNGYAFARAWADTHMALPLLRRLYEKAA